MSTRREVLALLSDGRLHSGAALGEMLGVTRAAVHRQIVALTTAGLPIDRLQGRGYRVREAAALLDADRIREQLDTRAGALLRKIEIFESIDSTNMRLLARSDTRGVVYLAEYQSAGRGRRGRVWHASAFGNLLFSVGWRYEGWPESIMTLSLSCAVAVSRGLQRCGIADTGIKWPNDIMWRGRKLAGILIDATGESAGSCRLAVGVGVNVNMAQGTGDAIDQDWTDIRTITAQVPDRNRLAAVLISEILAVLDCRVSDGSGDWRAGYERLDTLRGQRIALLHAGTGETVVGTGLGIDAAGALLVRDGNGVIHRFISGDVSVRPA